MTTSRVLEVIDHDAENRRFNMTLPSDTAYVEYFQANGFVNLHHIYVPPRYRTLGIGQDLAREVLEYCAENNIKVLLSCPYLATFYQQHPYPHFKKIVKGVVSIKKK
ncbi:hypothetical protein GE061_017655 [Apolygus lucorum]|uniref:Protein NATD1 n=1 Tax=Apolygus lucorum TaxID=248454 RepID=A0A6A4JBU6_APOLU|nr:hypothetical protein GE061_017655 [Apolygus lucorum]